MKYSEYIVSSEWRNKHREFLQKAGYRCAFSGLKIGKGKRYACHHMHYENLGNENYGRDIVCLHPWFHKWVIHGLLSGFKRPSQQKIYPNTAQTIAHAWCLLPAIVKLGLIGSGAWLLLTVHSPLTELSRSSHSTYIWATSSQFVMRSAAKLARGSAKRPSHKVRKV